MNIYICYFENNGQLDKEIYFPSLDLSIDTKGVLREKQISDIPFPSVKLKCSHELVQKVAKIANDKLDTKELLSELKPLFANLADLQVKKETPKEQEPPFLKGLQHLVFSVMNSCLFQGYSSDGE